MPIDYEPDAPRQSVEVLINGDLLSKAEALKVNLSALLEQALAETVARHQEGERGIEESRNSVEDVSVNRIDPDLMAAAMGVFRDGHHAVQWLRTPLRALGHKRPVDAGIEEVIDLLGRIEHGFSA
ncbi:MULTISPECIES: antitoxin Xre/MbcA/ParS toxin-binding domain-containing protein [Pseudomonas chlororaphis group]|uniref:antitoxin Xre/MbcA/ParS toxin-binding domain-containing protein n=1 Tax=Pseudomonas chlororaphis group TaxID=136842 RepID=UPI002096BF2F|nr:MULTISPECIES: type II toxin-antitoxin system CcdA family antitoxin [Pseudomonas chlororaphis group]MCO7575751.1 type II toxin-antitoxin system CcdA family antitoxin [Pseudomonas protegens]MCO7581411.1 type II toxin-antitoxin system CcdA family antitoxin [Pseudomonas chlororaphis]MCO7597564.1 type II toxin-antitoxin system CcdA family antitoxin [Pseudomonas chlororaphis]